MSKRNRNPNRQGFLNHVDTIRNAESDVDKLLDAARLQRIESGKRPVSTMLRIMAIIAIIAIVGLVAYIDMTASARPGAMTMLIGMGGIGAICAALFCGHGEQ
jgi:hypothetical protein